MVAACCRAAPKLRLKDVGIGMALPVNVNCDTINATFAAAVSAQPERLYLDFDGDRYTYARTDMEVQRFARGLHATRH